MTGLTLRLGSGIGQLSSTIRYLTSANLPSVNQHLSSKKSYKPRKPDPVSKLSFICDEHYCSPVAAYPEASGGPPSSASIRGITAPKVYPQTLSPTPAVSSYLTFSPSPRLRRGSYFLWHCLSVRSHVPALHRWGALRCPDFPSRLRRDDSSGL